MSAAIADLKVASAAASYDLAAVDGDIAADACDIIDGAVRKDLAAMDDDPVAVDAPGIQCALVISGALGIDVQGAP